MPTDYHGNPKSETQTGYDYEADPLWRRKPLTPAQVQVQTVVFQEEADKAPILEIKETTASSLVPHTASHTPSANFVRINDLSENPIERHRFTDLEDDYGWARHLRLRKSQRAHGPDDSAKCRWIHVSSLFPADLAGFLFALSDDHLTIADSLRILDQAVHRNTRFSKYGKYFSPFAQTLQPRSEGQQQEMYPMLMSVPFLDWTLSGSTPPLRYQIDRRERFRSTRSSAHMLRSILQYYYRLEETTDRESSQVFSKHKPWNTNRELDLKVRQWYGHYPSALNVDTLWVLAVDAEHIVTFSSNQTWKSRWPPLQLSSRISDVSFRDIRNNFFRSGSDQNQYNASTHAIACLSGAVGILHRNFLQDVVLCLTDRYAGHLGHLQYRLHRAPSTKLVMDLIAAQDELNIVIQITEQQLDVIRAFQAILDAVSPQKDAASPSPALRPVSGGNAVYGEYEPQPIQSRRATYRQLSSSNLPDPPAQVLDNLERELIDLSDLQANTDRLVTRTIQLVNIRLEDHGKAILIFTLVTIVFLPLQFVASVFGINTSDIRNMPQTQWLFWAVALAVTVAVLSASVLMAFSGGAMLEKISTWRDTRREHSLSTTSILRQRASANNEVGFRVYGTDKDDRSGY